MTSSSSEVSASATNVSARRHPTAPSGSLAGPTSAQPVLLALDPSFTATGWAVVELATERVVALGVIATEPRKPAQRRDATAALLDGERGLRIRRELLVVLRTFLPVVVVQEANVGSKSAKAAAALARAQQACLDAIDEHLGAEPVFVTPQAAKKAAVGRLNATKDDIEAAMRARWSRIRPPSELDELFGVAKQHECTGADLEALLREPLPSGERARPPGEWENAWDALAVAHAGWDSPAVGAARRFAQAAVAAGSTRGVAEGRVA